jgi:hypothetical protein
VSLVLLLVAPLGAQESASLRRAESAYRDLSYDQTIAQVRVALSERLSRAEQARAYELLGFAYGALDSARQSTEAFKQLLFLNPDRELDASRISPKITSLFALALGQVLVIRHLAIDSGAFLAGSGGLPIRFVLTRSARVRARIVGPSGEALVDSSLGDGAMRLTWNGLLRDGRPAPTGEHRLVIEASSGRDSYAASLSLRVVAGSADTLAQLTSLPGYQLLPEMETPPRSWRPLGIALLAAGATSGAIVALENRGLGAPERGGLAAIGVSTSVIGFLATMKNPTPVPAAANIRYNALLREQLVRRNGDIAVDNARRRRQVKLTVREASR